MAAEGPFLAAIIARLPDPKFNLAAYGVALAFAILIESPVIMIMSASTALVEDRRRLRRLRTFTFGLILLTTIGMGVFLLPPVFELVMGDLLGLPAEISTLVWGALLILLPWPGAIGYRRFYQGLLIRSGKTRLVAYGTGVRLVSMVTTALVLYLVFGVAGTYVGAAALSIGVCVEAVASRVMVRGVVRHYSQIPPPDHRPPMGYGAIAAFYYPLALTSMIGLAVQPMLTFFMGRAPSPVESLAVFPVVHALSFIFRAFGLSYQEIAIALMGEKFENVGKLWSFALGLGFASSTGLALIVFTPVAGWWFEGLSGLSPDLVAVALTPARILVILPFFSVMLSFQRSILVQGHKTQPITWATALEVLGVGWVLWSMRCPSSSERLA